MVTFHDSNNPSQQGYRVDRKDGSVAYKVAVGFEFFDDTNDILSKLDSFHLADELRDSGGKMILVTACHSN
jgi:hypothetical protein